MNPEKKPWWQPRLGLQEVYMEDTATYSWRVPPPTECNDPLGKTFRAELDEPRSISQPDDVQCTYCQGAFAKSEGYFYRDEFICDECVWILAENGEFYCG